MRHLSRACTHACMRQYERYILLNLLWPTVLVAASLTALVWLMQSLRFLDFMLNRGLGLGDFFYLTGLMLPNLLLMLLPVSVAIACIYVYNKLTTESELIVLSAVGVSRWQLAKPAIFLGGACLLVCYALALYVMPISNKHFRDIRTFFRDKYASVLLEEEVFNNPMDGVTVFIRERDSGNNLSGILLHDSRNPKQTLTMLADHGRVEQTPSGPRFYLQHGMRQTLEKGRVSWLAFDNYAVDLAFYSTNDARERDPDELGIHELFSPPAGTSAKDAKAYRAEAHQRLTWPAFALALPLLALSILFSSEFNRRGQMRRIVIAGATLAGLILLYFALRSMAGKHPMVAFGMYALLAGTMATSISLLFGERMANRRRTSGQLPAGVA